MHWAQQNWDIQWSTGVILRSTCKLGTLRTVDADEITKNKLTARENELQLQLDFPRNSTHLFLFFLIFGLIQRTYFRILMKNRLKKNSTPVARPPLLLFFVSLTCLARLWRIKQKAEGLRTNVVKLFKQK